MKEATKRCLAVWMKNEKSLAELHDKANNALDHTFHNFAELEMSFIINDEDEAEDVQKKLSDEIKINNTLGDALKTFEEANLTSHSEYKRLEMDLAESQGKIAAYAFAIQVLTGAVK